MNAWLQQWLSQRSVIRGNPTRRAKKSVHRFSSLAELKSECQKLGWHVVDTGDHYVVIPAGQMQVIC